MYYIFANPSPPNFLHLSEFRSCGFYIFRGLALEIWPSEKCIFVFCINKSLRKSFLMLGILIRKQTERFEKRKIKKNKEISIHEIGNFTWSRCASLGERKQHAHEPSWWLSLLSWCVALIDWHDWWALLYKWWRNGESLTRVCVAGCGLPSFLH